MPAGITSTDSMFSVRQTPWHGLGAVLDQPPTTIADAIERSGLGWRVEREPIAIDRGDVATVDDWWVPRCEEIPGWWANVRQDTRQVLGIVGERYRIVQNIEAFQFVDQLIGSPMHFETAGSVHGGRRVWVLAQLPDQIEVGGDPSSGNVISRGGTYLAIGTQQERQFPAYKRAAATCGLTIP
jgi:phage/plasmid-like protein (TIGR03299 family)